MYNFFVQKLFGPRAGIFVYGPGRAAARPGPARISTGRAQPVPTLTSFIQECGSAVVRHRQRKEWGIGDVGSILPWTVQFFLHISSLLRAAQRVIKHMLLASSPFNADSPISVI